METLFAREGEPDDAPFHAARHLDERAGDMLDPDRVVARHGGRWRPWTFTIAGREQVFWGQTRGERWAAFARVGVVRVVVGGYRWDRTDVRLAVVDPADYAKPADEVGSKTRR